jgi:phage shock protein PspC (stress-responsive transcriptional regulator)
MCDWPYETMKRVFLILALFFVAAVFVAALYIALWAASKGMGQL